MMNLCVFLLLGLLPVLSVAGSCQKTLVVGDSQLGWNMMPLNRSKPLTLNRLDRISNKSLGFLIYEHLVKNCPNEQHWLFAQGRSGVTDWMREFHPTVPFLSGSRVMLQTKSAFLVKRAASDIPLNQQKNYEIPALVELMGIYRPEKVIIALSANDWMRPGQEILELYRKLLSEVRGLVETDQDCVVQGVAGLDGRTTRSMRLPGEDESVTNQTVLKIHHAVSEAARAEGCSYVDMTSVHPTAQDGIHYQDQSAQAAFEMIRPYL